MITAWKNVPYSISEPKEAILKYFFSKKQPLGFLNAQYSFHAKAPLALPSYKVVTQMMSNN